MHEKHGTVEQSRGKVMYRPRLMGWYGGVPTLRMNMDNNFIPTLGAAGYQLSNPSVLDLACVLGALSVFNKTEVALLRSKSMVLTAYAEYLLDAIIADWPAAKAPFPHHHSTESAGTGRSVEHTGPSRDA